MPKLLEEIPTPELLDELMDRCQPACFIGQRHEGGDEGMVTWYEAKGHLARCYGLCQELAAIVQKDYLKQEEKQ